MNLLRRRRLRIDISLAVYGAFLAGLVSSHSTFADPARPAFDSTLYTHPQRLVTIAPGRRLNLFCTGRGSPVVVLDSGWGGPTTAWAAVQPAVSRFTETCSYDRAGQGFSDPGPLPRDTHALVEDLHTLLHAAGIAPPYVLVAHSLGGLDAVLFADRYRAELRGMVLVDPAFAHQAQQMAAIPGVAPALAAMEPNLDACADAAGTHRPLPKDCLGDDPANSVTLNAVLDQEALKPSFWIDLMSEIASFASTPSGISHDLDSAELDRASRPLGRLPLIVLTAADRLPLPGLPAAKADAFFDVWKTGHDRLAALSAAGRNQVVPNTSHYIQFHQPRAVIDAINEVVRDARLSRASAAGNLQR